MHLQNPEIKWKPNPRLHTHRPQRPASYITLGDGVEGKKGQNNRSPHPRQFGRALPHPHSWGGGKAWERATGAGLKRGGVVVPGGRKRRKKLLPLWPTPAPLPPPRAPGAQQTGWRWGQGGQGQTQALALAQPGRLGEGALPQDAPPKPGGKPSGKQAGKSAEKAAVNTSS